MSNNLIDTNKILLEDSSLSIDLYDSDTFDYMKKYNNPSPSMSSKTLTTESNEATNMTKNKNRNQNKRKAVVGHSSQPSLSDSQSIDLDKQSISSEDFSKKMVIEDIISSENLPEFLNQQDCKEEDTIIDKGSIKDNDDNLSELNLVDNEISSKELNDSIMEENTNSYFDLQESTIIENSIIKPNNGLLNKEISKSGLSNPDSREDMVEQKEDVFDILENNNEVEEVKRYDRKSSETLKVQELPENELSESKEEATKEPGNTDTESDKNKVAPNVEFEGKLEDSVDGLKTLFTKENSPETVKNKEEETDKLENKSSKDDNSQSLETEVSSKDVPEKVEANISSNVKSEDKLIVEDEIILAQNEDGVFKIEEGEKIVTPEKGSELDTCKYVIETEEPKNPKEDKIEPGHKPDGFVNTEGTPSLDKLDQNKDDLETNLKVLTRDKAINKNKRGAIIPVNHKRKVETSEDSSNEQTEFIENHADQENPNENVAKSEARIESSIENKGDLETLKEENTFDDYSLELNSQGSEKSELDIITQVKSEPSQVNDSIDQYEVLNPQKELHNYWSSNKDTPDPIMQRSKSAAETIKPTGVLNKVKDFYDKFNRKNTAPSNPNEKSRRSTSASSNLFGFSKVASSLDESRKPSNTILNDHKVFIENISKNIRKLSIFESTSYTQSPTTSSFPVKDDNVDWDFWGNLVNDFDNINKKKPQVVLDSIINGIPPSIRGTLWQLMTGSKDSDLEFTFLNLLRQSSPYEKAIKNDLSRTYPKITKFKDKNGSGQESMYNILKAYSLYDVEIGYCQGLSFLVGPLILNLPDEEAFSVLVRLMFKLDLRQHYTHSMEGLQVRTFQFERLLEHYLPAVYNHFVDQEIVSSMYVSQWFMTLFAYRASIVMVYSVFDVLLIDGQNFLFKLGLSFIKEAQDDLVTMEFEPLLEFLKVGIFKKFDAEISSIIRNSLQFFINEKKLRNWEKEYLTELRRLAHEEQVTNSLLHKKRKLEEEVRLLKEKVQQLTMDHCDLGNDLNELRTTVSIQNKENKKLKDNIAELEEKLKIERKLAENDLKSDLEFLAQKNLDLVTKNSQLEYQLSIAEEKILNSNSKKTSKWGF